MLSTTVLIAAIVASTTGCNETSSEPAGTHSQELTPAPSSSSGREQGAPACPNPSTSPSHLPSTASYSHPEDKRLGTLPPGVGIAVGSHLSELSALDQNGQLRSLKEFYSKAPILLTFYRGAWCPYCNFQLRAPCKTVPPTPTKKHQPASGQRRHTAARQEVSTSE